MNTPLLIGGVAAVRRAGGSAPRWEHGLGEHRPARKQEKPQR